MPGTIALIEAPGAPKQERGIRGAPHARLLAPSLRRGIHLAPPSSPYSPFDKSIHIGYDLRVAPSMVACVNSRAYHAQGGAPGLRPPYQALARP